MRRTPDKSLFLVTIILSILGILAVADASAPQALAYFNDSFFYTKQQIIWSILGIFAMIAVSLIHYKKLLTLAPIIFWASLAALVGVLIPGIGAKFLGARRWIIIGSVGFQPSEIVKLSLTIYFAALAHSKKNIKSYIFALAAPAALIMLQPDLGTTIIIVAIGLIQIFISGFPLAWIGMLVAGGTLSSLLLILTSSYRRERLLTFLNHNNDSQGSAYHITQVLIAISSGGLLGVGLGGSKQKYLFLPESATDSVFAVVAEEVGFLGSAVIIALFLFLIYRGLKIALNAPDDFSRVLAVGIVSWIAVQFFLNLSSMLAITPLTGVPLPFFSYGGSSLITIFVGLGILLNISRFSKNHDE